MLHSYFLLALRHFGRHKIHSVINVVGLTIGISACLLIYLFVDDELRFDAFHENGDRVFRVVNERYGEPTATDPGGFTEMRAATPPAMGPTLVREFAEVESAVRFYYLGDVLVEHDGNQIFEDNFIVADSTIFDVFTIDLVAGDPATALAEPSNLVISRSAAEKYFPGENPIGIDLTLWGDDVFTITGVFDDLPSQSHFEVDFLLAFPLIRQFVDDPSRLENWIWQQFHTYILLAPGADPASLEAKFPAFIERYADAETKARGFSYRTRVQPLENVYLRSAGYRFDVGSRGNITYVYAFSAIAVFVLMIACLNFMNLSTARAAERSREIGLRKVIGAKREQLVGQFLGEAVFMALAAAVTALLLVMALLPEFNAFAGKVLTISPKAHPMLVPAVLVGAILVGLFAGSYPAFYLSGFRPVRILKGSGGWRDDGRPTIRKALVVIQFGISTFLIVGMLVVGRQIDYLMEKDLGFDSDHVVLLQMRGEVDENIDAVKAELTRHPNIVAATASWGVPGSWAAGDGVQLPGSDTEWPTRMLIADYDFVDTYRMRVVAGRSFTPDFPSDANRAFVLNETATKDLGWTPLEAIGRELWWDEWGVDSVRKGEVIGVVEDFHSTTLHETIQPMVMLMQSASTRQLSIRVLPTDIYETLQHIEATVKFWAPDWPFDFEFLNEDLTEEYVTEQKLSTLVNVLSGLAILIACLGLFGLALHTAERRTKEIGVRKVLGATSRSIVLLLSTEFVRLVAVSFLLGAPLAWFALLKWLDTFAYHVDFGVSVFVVAAVTVMVIAVLTVAFHALRAAAADPVKTLRYE